MHALMNRLKMRFCPKTVVEKGKRKVHVMRTFLNNGYPDHFIECTLDRRSRKSDGEELDGDYAMDRDTS